MPISLIIRDGFVISRIIVIKAKSEIMWQTITHAHFAHILF